MAPISVIPLPNQITVLSDKVYKPNLMLKEIIDDSRVELKEEGYQLTIDDSGVTAIAPTSKGLFYAKQTFLQLCLADSLPNISIIDVPTYKYRGYMLDCARHFFTKEEIKKILNIMAIIKLNIFHWHLTDDQGFRITVPGYPKIEQIASKREGTRGDNKPISGFYSPDDIKEIVNYARALYIDIIPEIDMPGHFTAAISAYPQLSCLNVDVKVSQDFGIKREIACAGKESTYAFCKAVLKEVARLFPYKYIHLGGDEALKMRWLQCEHCQKKIVELGLKNEEELQAYFMCVMVEFMSALGKTVINWNDGLSGGKIPNQVVVHYWKENKECKQLAIKEVNKGKKLIMSPFFRYYLDYPYGMTSLKKTYNYSPNSIDILNKDNLLGIEAPLWTEYVANFAQLQHMTFPRLIALAERAWSEESQCKYDNFLVRLEVFNKVLDKQGIMYANIVEANPNFVKGKIQIIKFFARTLGRGALTTAKYQLETKRLISKKYKQK